MVPIERFTGRYGRHFDVSMPPSSFTMKLPDPPQSSPLNSENELSDPFMLPQFLRLNDAIERLTGDMIAHDPGVFECGRASTRHAVERQLYFGLIADRKVYDYFVACETGNALPDNLELSYLGQQIAPYFRHSRPSFGAPLGWISRSLRYLHRLRGRASIQIEGCGADRPQVLFLVIHPKFVRYLSPIADKLGVPYAFLVVEDAAMFDALREQKLPRVHIELTAESMAMTLPEVYIFGKKFNTGFFDSWIIRLKAFRRAFKLLNPDCIVVPEGNAAIYELVNQSAHAIRIPTLCVQQGWAPVVHPGFRNMSYSRMCVWGDEFAKMLAPYNPKQKFVVTGNHVVDCQPQGDIKKRRALAFFLQNGAHWLTEAAERGTLELIIWAAKRFPYSEIRVREHPGSALDAADARRLMAIENVRMMSPAEFALKDVFSECRVATAITSTTILEALASGVVPLILDIGGFGSYYPNIAADGAAVEVSDFDAARIALERLMSDDAFCASFAPRLDDVRQHLFVRSGDQALDAIVGEIRQVVGLTANR
jgi:hypothetical protein